MLFKLPVHFGQIFPEDVEPEQVIFSISRGRLFSANFETAVVVREIKRALNTLLGQERFTVGTLEDTPDSFIKQSLGDDTAAAIREVAMRLDPVTQQELLLLVPNASALADGNRLIETMAILSGFAAEGEPLPVPDIDITPTPFKKPSTAALAGGIFLALALIGAGTYYVTTRD
jgi:hypothetical protein